MTKLYQQSEIDDIVKALRSGELIAFPTDTVFGLGARCFDERTYHKIMKAKNRPFDKPLPVMVSDAKQIESLCVLTKREKDLIAEWMPGAITFVFNLKDEVLGFIESRTLAIRMPDDKWLLEVLDKSGPLWVTSANTSGEASKTNHNDVLKELDGLIDGIVVGESKSSIASSIFDLTGHEIKCLREGDIKLGGLLK